MTILVSMLLAGFCALGLVCLFEMVWLNRPPGMRGTWAKGQAMRFMWGASGILAVLIQFPLGIMLGIAALPVCLAHLRLVDQRLDTRIRASEVASRLVETARESFRNFLNRTHLGPRR